MYQTSASKKARISSHSLPETNSFAPENGWLEEDSFPFEMGLFSGAYLLVLVRVTSLNPEGNSHDPRGPPVTQIECRGSDGSAATVGEQRWGFPRLFREVKT